MKCNKNNSVLLNIYLIIKATQWYFMTSWDSQKKLNSIDSAKRIMVCVVVIRAAEEMDSMMS